MRGMPGGCIRRGAAMLLAWAALATGCSPVIRHEQTPSQAPDADVLVIGAGIAGLSAALEAEAAGARVIVVEANSVGGGHAVKAGGFALVDTPLQRRKGYQDSVAIARRDLMAWGETADAAWVERYLAASRAEVHDWLAGFGVRFTFILDTPEHSVPRFHFAGGSALNVVVPLMREAFGREGIGFVWNAAATDLIRNGDAVTGARLRDTRTGRRSALTARRVIVATGGFEASLDRVRANWRPDLPPPERLFVGAGQFATGSGLDLGLAAGADLARMNQQVIFTTGMPDPRDAGGTRALLTQNPSAIWVDASGRRFISETAPSKQADDAILGFLPATHWLVFDSKGLAGLRVRDAVWLDTGFRTDVLGNPAVVRRADTVRGLAAAANLPPATLEETVRRWNAAVAAGIDGDFGRFTRDRPDRFAAALATPPYYAIQLFPLTRKSMGGLRIDADTRVLDPSAQPIPGLYAAGEVTGVAGINGRYGGEGTFLGPSVYTGRIAGRAASAGMALPVAPEGASTPVTDPGAASAAIPPVNPPAMTPDELTRLVARDRPGYWHFQVAHGVVVERKLACADCHSAEWPAGPAVSRTQRTLQLATCGRCH